METVQDLLDRIERRGKRLGISKHPAWYRGHSNKSYSLVPSLFRQRRGGKHERNLFAVFGSEGSDHLDPSVNSWERLAIMQHHGVPTRLLDWTDSVHVALFFAVKNNMTMKVGKPCIWILNPFKLNFDTVGRNIVFDQDDKLDFDYYDHVKDNKWPYTLPLAITAPRRNPRIIAQNGYFTLHGSDISGIEVIAPKAVAKVDIPPHLVRSVITSLDNSGTDHFKMFPDLDGLANKLKRQFRLL